MSKFCLWRGRLCNEFSEHVTQSSWDWLRVFLDWPGRPTFKSRPQIREGFCTEPNNSKVIVARLWSPTRSSSPSCLQFTRSKMQRKFAWSVAWWIGWHVSSRSPCVLTRAVARTVLAKMCLSGVLKFGQEEPKSFALPAGTGCFWSVSPGTQHKFHALQTPTTVSMTEPYDGPMLHHGRPRAIHSMHKSNAFFHMDAWIGSRKKKWVKICREPYLLCARHFALSSPHSTCYTGQTQGETTQTNTHCSTQTFHTPRCLLHMQHGAFYALESALYTSHSILRTTQSGHYMLHTLHSTLHTFHSTVHTFHSTFHTLHSTFHTLLSTLPTRHWCWE